MIRSCFVLILLVGLLTGCQSQRAAFRFPAPATRPGPPEEASLPAVSAAPAPTRPTPPTPVQQLPPVRPARLLRAVAGSAGRVLISPGPHNHAERTVRSGRPAAARRQHVTAARLGKGDIQDLLSGVAFFGGIVLWVVVGGWAGFGLFALGLLLTLLVLYWSFGSGGMP